MAELPHSAACRAADSPAAPQPEEGGPGALTQPRSSPAGYAAAVAGTRNSRLLCCGPDRGGGGGYAPGVGVRVVPGDGSAAGFRLAVGAGVPGVTGTSGVLRLHASLREAGDGQRSPCPRCARLAPVAGQG